MPFTRISIIKGKEPEYHAALQRGIYEAMRDTFDVPEDDKFMVLHEHTDGKFDFGASYLDIERTRDLVMIQITANNTRTTDQKRALYAAICRNLGEAPAVRPEDVFISLVEVPKENWSFGHGIAQYA